MKKQWWHNKIAYQIYPKSFCDSDGDGIGDIPGIISKLDYLKDLGVDILWISPMYKSPFADQGYDIADYYAIDPVFGTMEDMERLLAEAKKREMYILMDLVINHCSSQHQWFQKALADPTGKYGDYFYIQDGKDGNAPTNLRTYFGGSAWEPIPGTDKFYLHMFAKEQPDLNWENPAVVAELYEMVNWWLDKGLAGFRIDAIVNIKKDLPFKDYPADRPDGLASPESMVRAATGVWDMLMDLHQHTFAPHGALSVAEMFEYDPEKVEDYMGDTGCFSTLFDFETSLIGASEKGFYAYAKPTANQYRDTFFASQKQALGKGFFSNIIENHDQPRGVSRYLADCNLTSKKMLATILMMARGLPFIYQGQEIGMENCAFGSMDEIDDVYTHGEYQAALLAGLSPEEAMEKTLLYSRDHSRTPMQWSSAPAGGFTTGTPWLKVNPNHQTINVAAQQDDEDSMLSYYKALIALKKSELYGETLVYGDFQPAYEDVDNVVAYTRNLAGQTILVVANFQNTEITLPLTSKVPNTLLTNGAQYNLTAAALTLAPYAALVLEMG